MECFNHSEAPAICICKVCGRAACKSCAVVTAMHVTCCEACSKEAANLHEMNQRALKIYGIGSNAKKKISVNVIMYLLFGVCFLGVGLSNMLLSHKPDWFSLVFGVVMLLLAYLSYRRSKFTGIQI